MGHNITPSQNGAESNDNKGVFHAFQSATRETSAKDTVGVF